MTSYEYEKPTNELNGDCSTGHCPCGPEPTTTNGTVPASFGPAAGLLSALVAAMG